MKTFTAFGLTQQTSWCRWKMPSGKGVTISVTAETDAGKRRHMEDYLDVRLAPSNEALRNTPGLKEQAFVGVFDGHGGKEAALYARERLWDLIQEQSKFRTTDRQKVAEAIKDAYLGLHREMEPMRRMSLYGRAEVEVLVWEFDDVCCGRSQRGGNRINWATRAPRGPPPVPSYSAKTTSTLPTSVTRVQF